MPSSFGVPYAPIRIEDDMIVRTCPVCGDDFEELTDATGELISNNYGEHCVAEHPDA